MCSIYRGSCKSAVFMNLLNELGKRDKMQSLPSIVTLFRNESTNVRFYLPYDDASFVITF